MDHLVACVICGGMDPNADSLLLQAAIAGGITAPWVLRARLLALISRLRGRPTTTDADDAACDILYSDDLDPPTSVR